MAEVKRVLVAPDKFRGSLTAAEAARHLVVGLARGAPGVRAEALPVADGGEGTVDAAVAAGFRRHTRTVTGPLGEPVRAAFALRGGVAVVELAEASGLCRLPGGVPAPLTATTHGTGELVRAALDAGARAIVLAVGGSATTDGGAGMLAALGARFTGPGGGPLGRGGGALGHLAGVDLSGLDPRIASVEVVLASDVDNPLAGRRGAAAVYGPQKGATVAEAAFLDAALRRYAEALEAVVGPRAREAALWPGAGAAGGAGYGAMAVLGAVRRPGAEVLLELLGFEAALRRARLVVTGEGSLDAQTLSGKAPLGVARAARRAGVEVATVCGRVGLGPQELASAGFRRVYALSRMEPDLECCMAQAGPLLERAAEAIARDLLRDRPDPGPDQ